MGFLFLILYPAPPPPLLLLLLLPLRLPVTHTHTTLSPASLSHTLSFTHNFVTHHLSHTTLSHAIFHTQLCHTHTHCVTHHLSHTALLHTSLSHTIFHTQLCHTHTQLCHAQLCHTPFSHTTLSHASFHTQLCHTPSFTRNFVTHLATSTFHLCGARGTWRHLPSFCVAGVALRFVWPAWHLWHWAGSGGALGAPWSPVTPRQPGRRRHGTFRGRRSTWRHRPSCCVAGMELLKSTFVLRGRRSTYDTGLDLVARLGAVCRPWRRRSLRGRRGTWRPRPWVFRGRRGTYDTGLDLVACLGAVCRPWRPRHFVWQAWHLATSTFVLHGMRGTCSHQPSFCVAGVAHMTLGWIWWRAWAPLVARCARGTLRGRGGTWRPQPSSCVAGVALMTRGWIWWRAWAPLVAPVLPRHCAWRAWYLATSTFGSAWQVWGSWRHRPSFCVAGVALKDIGVDLVARLGAISRPWRRGTLPGRRGTWRHRTSCYVAQAWRLKTSTFVELDDRTGA